MSASQKQRILELLVLHGTEGVTNIRLNKDVGFRYGARIFELRRAGFDIETVTPDSNSPVRKFILHTPRNLIDWDKLQAVPAQQPSEQPHGRLAL